MHIVCWVIMFKFESVDILRETNELIYGVSRTFLPNRRKWRFTLFSNGVKNKINSPSKFEYTYTIGK